MVQCGVPDVIKCIPAGIPQLSDPSPRYSHNIHSAGFPPSPFPCTPLVSTGHVDRRNCHRTLFDRRKFMTLSVHLCVKHDGRDAAARRAGPSATADTCCLNFLAGLLSLILCAKTEAVWENSLLCCRFAISYISTK